jgi:electron transport complex protein RnfE
MSYSKIFTAGLWKRNPILVLGIGLCPALAVSTSLSNAIWMTIGTTFVLMCSNFIISLIKKFIAPQIRIPVFIVVIAAFVTLVELILEAYQPAVYNSLGIFISLIVVNCMILGRAEEFAYKNDLLPSVVDGLGMGLGFGFALCVLAFFREVLGANKIFGITVISGMQPALALIMAPGAFFVIGFMLWFMNYINNKKAQ